MASTAGNPAAEQNLDPKARRQLAEFRQLQEFRRQQGQQAEADPMTSDYIEADTPGRRVKSAAARQVPSYGGFIGGAIGTAVGGALGMPVQGGTIGAGIGGAISSAGTQAVMGEVDRGRVGMDALLEGTVEFVSHYIPTSKAQVQRALVGKAAKGAAAAEETFRRYAKDMEKTLLAEGHDPGSVRSFVDDFSFTLSQMSENEFLRFTEEYSRGSIFTGQGLREADRLQQAVLVNLAEAVANKVGPAMDEGQLGRFIAERIKSMRSVGKHQQSVMYRTLDERMAVAYRDIPDRVGGLEPAPRGAFGSSQPGTDKVVRGSFVPKAGEGVTGRPGVINLRDSSKLFERTRQTLEALKGKAPDPEGVNKMITIADGLARATEDMSFAQVKEVRSQIRELVQSAVSFDAQGRMITSKPSYAAAGEELYDFLTGKMRRAVKEVDDVFEQQRALIADAVNRGEVPAYHLPRDRVPGLQLFDDTNNFTREIMGGIESETFRGAIIAADEKRDTVSVVKHLFPDGNVEQARFVRDKLGVQSHEMNATRSWHVNRILRESKGDPDAMIAAFTSPRSEYGLETLRTIHGDKNLIEYVKVAKSLKFLSRTTSKEGSMVPRLVEAGAIGGTAMSIPIAVVNPAARKTALRGIAASGVYFITAKAMSRWLTNPTLRKQFLEFTGAKPGSQRAVSAAMHLMASLTRDDYLEIPGGETPEQYSNRLRNFRQMNS